MDTLLVVGDCSDGEDAMNPAAHGLVELSYAEALRGDPSSGFCRLPELGRGLSPRSDWRAYRRLRALIDARRPDLVHTHTSKAGALGRMAASRSTTRPRTVHTFHGLVLRDYASRPVSDVARRIERFLARRTDLCLAVSESCRRELRELGVTSEAVVVPPAVPVRTLRGRDQARKELGLPSDRVVVGFVGRPAPVKRFEMFQRMFSSARVDELGWLGVASGMSESEVSGCSPNLRMLGSDPEIASKLMAFDVLVMPSKREGMPLVAIEAARAGVPVVGFDVPGVRDAIDILGLGCVVPGTDSHESLIDGVAQVLAESRSPSTPSRELDRFDPGAVAGRLRALYGELVATR